MANRSAKSPGLPCPDLRGVSHVKFRRLTAEQVARARAISYVRISDGFTIWAEMGKDLAREFGVSVVTIHNVRYNLVYKDLPPARGIV